MKKAIILSAGEGTRMKSHNSKVFDKVIILTGDTPLIKQETLKKFFDFHEQQNSVATVLTSEIDDPFGYGRIVKDGKGNLLKIVEQKDCNDEQLLIKEFNSGMMIVNGDVLKMSIEKIGTDNSKGEMYLTDIFEIIRNDGKIIKTFKHSDVNETYGINTKAQLYFCEEILIKNSTVGNKTKAGHLAYVGDSDLKENINIGCGVIFVNYDGKNKHRSVVEDNVFVGSNSNVIAPVTLKKDSFIACGTTITEDVEEGALSIGRSRQENKKDWVYNKKR